MRKLHRLRGAQSSVSRSVHDAGRFLGFIPNKVFAVLRFFVWPKESRRRYRTAILAVFLFAFLAANLNYPKYWDAFADWVNPKLDAIDMPEWARRQDKGEVFRTIDAIANVPHFWDIPFSLGLDLRGGIHLIYSADLSKIDPLRKQDAMNGLRDVIERRVNLFGVREPNVLVQEAKGEYRLLVELAGIQDFNQAIEMIGQTPYLEFKEERPLDDQKRILAKVFKDQEISDDELLSVCANVKPQFIAFVLQTQGEDPCFTSIDPKPLTGEYLKDAVLQFDPNTNQPTVALELDDTGAAIFEEVTGRNIDKLLAIYIDNYLINWPRVQEKISGGRAQITGFKTDGARALARNLNAGALPVPITLISEVNIGASLGEESLKASLRAGIIGFIAVVLYMVMLYRLSGFLAVVALAIYFVLLLAAFKLIPVTLTLPGIAGFILSIGMAVDANILILERLREELGDRPSTPAGRFQQSASRATRQDAAAARARLGLNGKSSSSQPQDFLLALNHAYARAWPSIRDGNVTTLLTCLILFWFSTSFIKGFALTLGIGVTVSMFSAMIVTKHLIRLLGEGRLGKGMWFWIR